MSFLLLFLLIIKKCHVLVVNLFNLSTGDVEEDAIRKFPNLLGQVPSSRVHTWKFRMAQDNAKVSLFVCINNYILCATVNILSGLFIFGFLF